MPSDPKPAGRLPVPERPPMGGPRHAWHVAVNKHVQTVGGFDDTRFMYEAMTAMDEVARLVIQFRLEADGGLPTQLHRCSHDIEGTAVPDNHLTCCLGVRTRECPHLRAIESAEMSPTDILVAKAWTCVAHIVTKGGDHAREGYVLSVDDRMYWDGVYESLAMGLEDGNG